MTHNQTMILKMNERMQQTAATYTIETTSQEALVHSMRLLIKAANIDPTISVDTDWQECMTRIQALLNRESLSNINQNKT